MVDSMETEIHRKQQREARQKYRLVTFSNKLEGLNIKTDILG